MEILCSYISPLMVWSFVDKDERYRWWSVRAPYTAAAATQALLWTDEHLKLFIRTARIKRKCTWNSELKSSRLPVWFAASLSVETWPNFAEPNHNRAAFRPDNGEATWAQTVPQKFCMDQLSPSAMRRTGLTTVKAQGNNLKINF